MFLNSQALWKCLVLGAGCLDSQAGAFLPTAPAASPPIRPLPHFCPLPSPPAADPSSSQNVLQLLGGPMRMGLPEASRICVGGAVPGAELRGCFQNVPSLCRPRGTKNHISLDSEGRFWRGSCVFAHVVAGRRGKGGLHQASHEWVEQPLKQLFPACIACISRARAPCLFVGVSSTSPWTQGPCSESPPASSRRLLDVSRTPPGVLPVPREAAESGCWTWGLERTPWPPPLHLQGSFCSSQKWPQVSTLTWEGLGRKGGRPVSVALPARPWLCWGAGHWR